MVTVPLDLEESVLQQEKYPTDLHSMFNFSREVSDIIKSVLLECTLFISRAFWPTGFEGGGIQDNFVKPLLWIRY